MTAYHGGKQRTGNEIADIIGMYRCQSVVGYCEPFCGMLGVYQHIPTLFDRMNMKYLGGDMNKSVILMWKKAQKGWKPPQIKISREEFMTLKYDGKSTAEKGFIGHFYGYMGKYFQPFHGNTQPIKNITDKISNIAKSVRDVKFHAGSYKQFSDLKNYIIYCDPPYAKQAHYYTEFGDHMERFDHVEFWQWCIMMSKYNIVFVSEYNIPKGISFMGKNLKAKCVWSGVSRTTGSSQTEKLYVINSK